MRLPDQMQLGVQSKGRHDIMAPLRLGQAEAAAAVAWGNAFSTAADTVGKLALAEGMADAQLTLSERIATDKRSAAELDQYLANTRVIDLGEEDVPDSVRTVAENYADMVGITDGRVETYTIAMEATAAHHKRTRNESFLALAAKDGADKTQMQYNKAMDDVWAAGAANSVNTHITQRLSHLGARAELMLSNHMANLDEASAYATIIEAEQSGVWTPEYASTKLASVGGTIDVIKANSMYRDATTQGEVDAADDFTDTSRITPEQRLSLMKLSDQRQEHLYQLGTRAQGVVYGDAQALLTENKLTKQMVVDMVSRQEINGAQANTLRTALNTPTPIASDPALVDDLRGNIAALRFATEDDQPVTERVNTLRKELLSKFTGVGDYGPVDKTLTGGDFEELMGLLDEHENLALGKGGQRYTNAVRTIKALTGYSDSINKLIEGPYPAGEAYAAFTTALQDYMDTTGVDAEPEEFIARNASRFTADKYAQSLRDRLASQFPQYGPMIQAMTRPTEVVPSMVGPAQPATVGSVLDTARQDVINGTLTPTEWEMLRRSLDYLTYDTDPAQTSAGGFN